MSRADQDIAVANGLRGGTVEIEPANPLNHHQAVSAVADMVELRPGTMA